jgi:hypothetical protein
MDRRCADAVSGIAIRTYSSDPQNQRSRNSLRPAVATFRILSIPTRAQGTGCPSQRCSLAIRTCYELKRSRRRRSPRRGWQRPSASRTAADGADDTATDKPLRGAGVLEVGVRAGRQEHVPCFLKPGAGLVQAGLPCRCGIRPVWILDGSRSATPGDRCRLGFRSASRACRRARRRHRRAGNHGVPDSVVWGARASVIKPCPRPPNYNHIPVGARCSGRAPAIVCRIRDLGVDTCCVATP